jgi:hypothetical protein
MIKAALTATAVCLVSAIAFADDDHCRYTANCDYEIRERLLSIPVWNLEFTRAQRTQVWPVRFEKRGYKLFGIIDAGIKCENEVEFVEKGFLFDSCPPSQSREWVQVDGDIYQSIKGSYILTLRPPR